MERSKWIEVLWGVGCWKEGDGKSAVISGPSVEIGCLISAATNYTRNCGNFMITVPTNLWPLPLTVQSTSSRFNSSVAYPE